MIDLLLQNYQWIVPLIVGGILVPFIIHRLQNRNKGQNGRQETGPEIHITENWVRHFFNIEILNTGQEDVINFSGKIYWKQGGQSQERELTSFISENEDQLFASPRNYKILRKNEKIIAVNIPHFSDDGKIRIVIKGSGSASKKGFEKSFTISNKIKNK